MADVCALEFYLSFVISEIELFVWNATGYKDV